MNYSNLVTQLSIKDWPYGSKRVQCDFTVEQNKGKERAVRVTENPRGGVNKPKKLTYVHKVRFATGDDGRTYILNLTEYGAIGVMQSNMKYQEEYFSEDDSRYADLIDQFKGDI